jgi:hypothetical protein
MMRYQIKEALDNIEFLTEIIPNELSIISAEPNDIRLSHIDDKQQMLAFKYSNGRVYCFDEAKQTWLPLDQKPTTH